MNGNKTAIVPDRRNQRRVEGCLGAGPKRNEQFLSLTPRYVIAYPGNGVLERLVIDAKARRISVVDRRGPLGTPISGRYFEDCNEAAVVSQRPEGRVAGVAGYALDHANADRLWSMASVMTGDAT